MSESTSAAEFLPDSRSLRSLHQAALDCRGCALWKDATQTVFGIGPRKAKLMLVGEQPGDKEDIEGEPFVGPAGRELDRALEEAGIDRADVYLTNAVKHFRWRPRGGRRLHETPRVGEVTACRPWLEAVGPVGIIALGATAGRSLFGPRVKVGADRGRLLDSLATLAAITAHPSAILRLRDREGRDAARAEFVADLRMVAEAVATHR